MDETEKELLLRVAQALADDTAGIDPESEITWTPTFGLTVAEMRTISRVLREAAEGWSLQEENSRLRQHIAHIHNRVRHELSAAIEAASDKAFEAMAGTTMLRPIPPPPATETTNSQEPRHD